MGDVLFLMSESPCLQLRLTLKVSRGTEPQVGAVPCGAAHHMPGCLLRCSGSPHAGSSEQAGAAHGTVFVISSLRPPDRAEQPGAYSAIPFQGPVPSLCVRGQPGPGVPAGLARLFPTQNPVSHSHRLLCFSTLLLHLISLPIIPVGSSILHGENAANTGQAHNVLLQPVPHSRTWQLLH